MTYLDRKRYIPFTAGGSSAVPLYASNVIIQGWELQKDEKSVTGTGQDWYYHWKAEELTRVNKSALVPTLITIDPDTQETDETKVS